MRPIENLKSFDGLMSSFLGGLDAIALLAIDTGLAGFAATASALNVSTGQMSQTLGGFLLGFSLGPLILSLLSDRFGYQRLVLVGLSIVAVGVLACAWTHSFAWMLAARTLQGLGAGVVATIPFAIARDLYELDDARVKLSVMTLLLGTAPIAVPVIGCLALNVGAWRSSYSLLAVGGAMSFMAAALFKKESAPANGTPLTPRNLIKDDGGALQSRPFLANALVNDWGLSLMFASIAGPLAVLLRTLGLTSVTHSVFFVFTSGSVMGSLLNARLAVRGIASRRIVIQANVLVAGASTVTLGLASFGASTPIWLAATVAIALLGWSLPSPNAARDLLQSMRRMAGTAAAVLRRIQMTANRLASTLVGVLQDGTTPLSMALVMYGLSIASIGIQRIGKGPPKPGAP